LKAPRLEIKLNQLHHNAKKLIENLALQGISITGVSKATMAMPEIVYMDKCRNTFNWRIKN